MSDRYVFTATDISDDWAEARAQLQDAFEMSREAAQAEESFVYVVHNDDLLGRRGAGKAMVASGLLSAARTAAAEGANKGWTVNVLAVDDSVDQHQVDQWISNLLQSNGVTGELIRIGPTHVGKALP